MIVSDERVARFVSERIGFGLFPPFTAMGIERGGEIVAGVLFNCFEGKDLHVTIAGHGWTKDFCIEVGRYVYDVLGYERMTIQTESPQIVDFVERLGGQIEGLKRNHFGEGRDAFICGILKSEYRFRGQ